MNENNSVIETLKKLYVRISILSLSTGALSPILPYLLILSGGGAFESGLFQSLNNLFNSVGQAIWGRVSDLIGRRKILLVIGVLALIIISFPLTVLIFLNNLTPYIIIALSSINTLLTSTSIPVLTSIIIDIAPYTRRSHVYSLHSSLSTLFTLAGNIIATTILFLSPQYIGFCLVSLLSLISAFIALAYTLSIPSTVIDVKNMSLKKNFIETFIIYFKGISMAMNNPRFKTFVLINTFYNFALSIAWPLFPISQVKVIKMAPYQVVILSIVSNTTITIGQYIAGRYIPRYRYRLYALLNRFGLIAVPLVYAFASNAIHLYILGVYTGLISGIANIVFALYIVECANRYDRATYMGVYGTLTGMASFIGSFIGGLISSIIIENIGIIEGLKTMYLVAAFARFLMALIVFKTKKFIL